MTDPPRHPETGDGSGMRYDGESTTSIPRWVKLVGIVAAVLALLVVVGMLIGGGGGHGPRRHISSSQTPTSSVTDERAASGVGLGGHTLFAARP